MFHPETAGEDIGESSWLNSGNQKDLMTEMEGFSAELRELCGMAEDLKLWSLASRDPPDSFNKGKLALIGDAAHPTLPRKQIFYKKAHHVTN
jgi:salicylate hydroxylase